MKTVIHLLLFLVSLGLMYALYSTIKEPIQFKNQYNKRSEAVVTKLKDIRIAQKLYRTITDTFAESFTDLENVLSTGRFEIIQVHGDRDAIGSQVTYDTLFVAAKDSIASLGLNIKELKSVPFTDKQFDIFAVRSINKELLSQSLKSPQSGAILWENLVIQNIKNTNIIFI